MMKKSLSLILALALMLCMTAFASQQTQVYLVGDFESYNTASEILSVIKPDTSLVVESSGGINAANALSIARQSSQNTENATWEIYNLGNKITTATSERAVNTNGKASFKIGGSGSGYAGMLLVPNRTWDFIDNPDEIYVFSYDVDVNPKATSSTTTYNPDPVFFTDDARENAVALRRTYYTGGVSNVSFYVNSSTSHGSGSWSKSMVPDTTYRVTFGWTWTDDVKAVYTDAEGNSYNVPRRYFYCNGAKWSGNNYTSVSNWGTDHGFKGKSDITALGMSWENRLGFEFADMLIYTVKNDSSAFAVSMIDDTVELDENAVVKFNIPIYGGSLTKESITMTEDGASFTMFELGAVKNVVDETSGEVYTTAEIIFPYGKKAGATYVITVNNTVKSELSWTIPEGNNTTSFTTGAAPSNIVTLSATSGLAGDGDDVTSISSTQAKFKAVATASEKPSFLFIGIYEGSTLISYTYTTATTGDEISLATKVAPGQTVKAFSCGSVYDLEYQVFGTPGTPIN